MVGGKTSDTVEFDFVTSFVLFFHSFGKTLSETKSKTLCHENWCKSYIVFENTLLLVSRLPKKKKKNSVWKKMSREKERLPN